MNTKALRHVRKMFAHDAAPAAIQRHNMRAWVRSVRLLGDRWLLAKSVRRSEVA